MATLVTDLGLYSYGSNPEFDILFEQEDLNELWAAADPQATPHVNLTDGAKSPVTVSLTPVSTGHLRFEVDGGLHVPGTWTGRAFAGPGDGEASVDFKFKVEATKNP